MPAERSFSKVSARGWLNLLCNPTGIKAERGETALKKSGDNPLAEPWWGTWRIVDLSVQRGGGQLSIMSCSCCSFKSPVKKTDSDPKLILMLKVASWGCRGSVSCMSCTG